jgi:hypothetical protein
MAGRSALGNHRDGDDRAGIRPPPRELDDLLRRGPAGHAPARRLPVGGPGSIARDAQLDAGRLAERLDDLR